MGRGTNDFSLIPARFLATMGHLVATLMVSYSREEYLYAALGSDPTTTELDAAKRSLVSALTMSYICFALDILGMLGGFTIFFSKINLFQIILHIIGGIYTSWLITYSWSYETMWYITGFTNIPTALAEVGMLVAIFVFKIVVY